MKNKGVKFLVLLVLIAVLGGLIYFVISKNKANNPESLEKTVENKNINYFLYLGQGGNTNYNGMDLIFTGNKVTYKDLSVGNVLTAAFNYVMDSTEDSTALDPSLYAELNTQYDLDDMDVLKGDLVRKAIKKLFGVKWEDKGYSNSAAKYAFAYSYDAEFDVYLRSTIENNGPYNSYLTYKVLNTEKKKDSIITTVVIAYANKVENGYDIYSDFMNENLVTSQVGISLKEWKDEDLDKLEKYVITSKLVEEDYVFESLEPAK